MSVRSGPTREPDLATDEIDARFQAALLHIKRTHLFTIDPDARKDLPADAPYRSLL